ncbi:MAG: LysR substrate-binding domain-containing protein, partial [Myxococcota bacterium]
RLRVSHPTVSAQIRELEGTLEVQLFERGGRSLELTEVGRRVFAHAERIFAAGRALIDDVRAGSARATLRIGVTDDLPKLLVRELLEPALEGRAEVRLTVDEERHRTLLGRLAVRELDLVLSDSPTPPAYRIQSEDRYLGHSGVSFLAAARLRARLEGPFPKCLAGAPFLAPLSDSRLGRLLETWFTEEGLGPDIVAEVADSALLKTLGSDGLGVFVVPRVAEAAACERYEVEVVGRVDALTVEYFATTPSRSGKHPLVEQILAAAESRIGAANP